jgi:hypothetical protein
MSKYSVGYGKPPKASQFKKGQSGNPKGRPKGQKNLKTDLEEELQGAITVTEGGKKASVSKQRALIKALLAKGLSGDIRAMSVVIGLMLKVIDPQGVPSGVVDLPTGDLDILERFLTRHGVGADMGGNHD